jgi:hypothetical protein
MFNLDCHGPSAIVSHHPQEAVFGLDFDLSIAIPVPSTRLANEGEIHMVTETRFLAKVGIYSIVNGVLYADYCCPIDAEGYDLVDDFGCEIYSTLKPRKARRQKVA